MKTKKADALTSARQNELHFKSYQIAIKLSILKEKIGWLPLYLQTPLLQSEQRDCWQAFELYLREFYEGRGL